MPLGKDVSKNIRELYHANDKKPETQRRPRKQIIAIAYAAAKRNKKK